jgi:hypothetical protein
MSKPRSLLASVLFALSVSSIAGGSEGGWLRIVIDGKAYQHRDLLVPGAAICVFEDSSYPASSIQRQLAQKLSRLLTQKGYGLKSLNEADLGVVLRFGTEQAERRYAQYYVHYVLIKVFNAAVYRDTGKMRMVWEGGAKHEDRGMNEPERPLELLDLLLVAAVERFGKRRSRAERLRLDDPRAVAIRQPFNKGL